MEEKHFNIIQLLKTYWFLIVALFVGSVAWGQTTLKVQTLEEAVKHSVQTQIQVKVLDERTQSIKDEQKYQRELLEQILRNQKR